MTISHTLVTQFSNAYWVTFCKKERTTMCSDISRENNSHFAFFALRLAMALQSVELFANRCQNHFICPKMSKIVVLTYIISTCDTKDLQVQQSCQI